MAVANMKNKYPSTKIVISILREEVVFKRLYSSQLTTVWHLFFGCILSIWKFRSWCCICH